MIVTDLKAVRQQCRETSLDEIKELKVYQKIQDALKTGWCDCVGLAAIQVGVPIKYAWYQIQGQEAVELVNPVVVRVRFGQVHRGEGCMSIPKKRYEVWRYNYIAIINYDQSEEGRLMEFSGFEAMVVQHEIDHFLGVLCCDIKPPVAIEGRNGPCPCGSEKKFKKCCG